MAEQPNIIVVFADQMRGQAMACAGDEQMRTPCGRRRDVHKRHCELPCLHAEPRNAADRHVPADEPHSV